jgi:hypothetical protein
VDRHKPGLVLPSLHDPDGQYLRVTRWPLELARNSVLPAEPDVFGVLHITDGGYPAELRDEEVGRGAGEAECGEEPCLEAANWMARGEEIPSHLEIVDSNVVGSRELQLWLFPSVVRRAQR